MVVMGEESQKFPAQWASVFQRFSKPPVREERTSRISDQRAGETSARRYRATRRRLDSGVPRLATDIGPVLDDLLAWLRRRSYRESTIRKFVVRAGRLCRCLQQGCGPALDKLCQSDVRSAYNYFREQQIEVACVSRVLGLFLAERQLLRAEHEKPLTHVERQIQSFSTQETQARQSSWYFEGLTQFVPQKAAGNRLYCCGGSEADSGSDRLWYPMRNLWPAYALAT
jgi:hypothetical protein